MQNTATNLFKALICIVFLSIGYIFGKHNSFAIYYFKKDLDIVGIATIFVNIFLAWYISRVIGKKNDIDKKDKDIILNRLDRVISNWEIFITQVHSNNLNYIDVTSFIKRNIFSIEQICNNFSEYHNFDYLAMTDEINKEKRKILTLMTYTSPYLNQSSNSNLQEPVTILHDIISYTPARIDEILLNIEVMIGQITKLQMFINSK